MAELEKVIKGLECCSQGLNCAEKCPYDDDNDDCNECTSALTKDALELLKTLDSVLKFLAECGLDLPCDELPSDDGWCDEHCSSNGQTKDCWLRYFSKISKDGEQ